MDYRLGLIGLAVVLAACQPTTKPQRPTRRGEARPVDSTLLALMTINSRLADEADKNVTRYIQSNNLGGYQMDCGAWQVTTTYADPTDTITPHDGELWALTMIVTDLNGTALANEELTVRIPSQDLPPAARDALTSLHRGDRTRLICPWYAAYGAVGNDNIPAYTNCVIDIYIHE